MKIRTYKRTTKNYEPVFNKEKETKEIQLRIGDIELYITEHQYDIPLNKPHVDISIGDTMYSMDFERFIKKGIS